MYKNHMLEQASSPQNHMTSELAYTYRYVIYNSVYVSVLPGDRARDGGSGRSDVPRRHLCLGATAGRRGLFDRRMGPTFFRG